VKNRPILRRRRTVTVIINLVLVALVVFAFAQRHTSPQSTTGIVVSTVANESPALSAMQEACTVGVVEVQSALTLFKNEFHHLPPSGTQWFRSMKLQGVQVQYWPSGLGYSITWNGASVGVTPSDGASSSGNGGSAQRNDGCFGIHL